MVPMAATEALVLPVLRSNPIPGVREISETVCSLLQLAKTKLATAKLKMIFFMFLKGLSE
jgi:hypothetical protein